MLLGLKNIVKRKHETHTKLIKQMSTCNLQNNYSLSKQTSGGITGAPTNEGYLPLRPWLAVIVQPSESEWAHMRGTGEPVSPVLIPLHQLFRKCLYIFHFVWIGAPAAQLSKISLMPPQVIELLQGSLSLVWTWCPRVYHIGCHNPFFLPSLTKSHYGEYRGPAVDYRRTLPSK